MQNTMQHSQPYPHIQSPFVREHIQSCADECMRCARLCEECISECVRMNMAGMARPTELCRDCADACMLAMKFLVRESPYFFEACKLCAKVCEACSIVCDEQKSLHTGSEIFSDCAAVCQRCAGACKQVSAISDIHTLLDS